jgi:hypothetical protein
MARPHYIVRGQEFVFTVNNPQLGMFGHLSQHEEVVYAVYQLESGQDGTEHLQGYIEMARMMTWAEAASVLGTTKLWLQRRNSTRGSARDYCMKSETRIRGPWEIGTWAEDSGPDPRQCTGTTKNGTQCRHVAYHESGLCKQHQGSTL